MKSRNVGSRHGRGHGRGRSASPGDEVVQQQLERTNSINEISDEDLTAILKEMSLGPSRNRPVSSSTKKTDKIDKDGGAGVTETQQESEVVEHILSPEEIEKLNAGATTEQLDETEDVVDTIIDERESELQQDTAKVEPKTNANKIPKDDEKEAQKPSSKPQTPSTCPEPGYDPAKQCKECLQGFDINRRCQTCIKQGFDPARGCTNCLPGLDPRTRCTSCSQGFDPSTNCQSCHLGLDRNNACRTHLPGFETSACSFDTGCSRCRVGWDPMASCSRCVQGRGGNDCMMCLPGWGPARDGKCELICRTPACWNLHIIGDTHGDHNYLVRALLSTGRFRFNSRRQLVWRDFTTNTFEIVFLGDAVDRGRHSKKNLQLLRDLANEDRLGRLKFVLGNHESLLLQHDFDSQYEALKIDPTLNREALKWHVGNWTEEEIKAAHRRQHKSATLLDWLRIQPVILDSWGVLMCHGGLSQWAADQLIEGVRYAGRRECNAAGRECGGQVVDLVNRMAIAYYKNMKDSFAAYGPRLHAAAEPVINHGSHGILWYRGYSKPDERGQIQCNEAANVGHALGGHIMAVAHTTHAWIQRYCARQHPKTQIFATDTHFQDCVSTGECDYADKFEFHKDGRINFELRMVPQSLELTIGNGRISHLNRCLVVVLKEGKVNIERKCVQV